MNIKIKLNHAFQSFAGNREVVEVEGSSIKECLDNLIDLFPIFKKLLFDDDGALRALVLLDGDTVVMKNLNRPVTEKSEMVLMPMIEGG